MTYLNISILLLICISLFLLYYFHKRKKRIDILKVNSNKVEESTNEFNSLLDDKTYLNHRKYLNWKEKYAYIKEKVNFDVNKSKLPVHLINPFRKYFHIVEKKKILFLIIIILLWKK